MKNIVLSMLYISSLGVVLCKFNASISSNKLLSLTCHPSKRYKWK